MFDIGFFELLLIAVLGLIVIGPARLPEVVRSISLWIGRLKRSISNVKQDMEREFHIDEVRRQLHNEEVMRRLNASKQEIERAVSGQGPEQTTNNKSSDSTTANDNAPAQKSNND
ncbi:Sec-independent protein translocase protein TatB [Porticoccaceae bacterium LTM1]|nr:Sec-independent protein translocase protein TatB [Porticoccaceae bacterium LTM1]